MSLASGVAKPQVRSAQHALVGGHLTGSSLINFAARNIDNVLIGRYWGPTQLGLYSRAYQLLLLPLEQINAPLDTVAITSLSKLTDSPERYRQAYLRMLEKIVMVTMPGIALMIVTSDWLVRVMLGPQWVESGRIFALLGVMGILEPVSFTLGWLMVSQARTKEFMHMVIFNSVTSILAIILGLRWGAIGVAATYALSGVDNSQTGAAVVGRSKRTCANARHLSHHSAGADRFRGRRDFAFSFTQGDGFQQSSAGTGLLILPGGAVRGCYLRCATGREARTPGCLATTTSSLAEENVRRLAIANWQL